MYILLSLVEQSNGMIHNIVKSSKDPCAPLKTKDNCKHDVDNICVWCKSGAVPDSCIPLEKAKTLPPAIFFCDFPDEGHAGRGHQMYPEEQTLQNISRK